MVPGFRWRSIRATLAGTEYHAMRFPHRPGSIAGTMIRVTDLARANVFWRAVLQPLGFGRIAGGPDRTLWAREDAQILMFEDPEPTANCRIWLRAPSREAVDGLYEQALAEGWSVPAPPAERPFGPGYYSCTIADPDGIRVELIHAWTDLPPRADAEHVRVSGVDDVMLGGYLFRPAHPVAQPPGIIVLHGFGGDATSTVPIGQKLAAAGFVALCLSLRGWLGSTGDEDQGFRQPDDIVAAADWLRREARSVALLGLSQGGQVALLAASRRSAAPFACVVAFYPTTDTAAWREETQIAAVVDYLDDFVPAERFAAISPITVAERVSCPTLILHGENDINIPLAHSRRMVEANPAIRLRVVAGAGHGFAALDEAMWPETLAFLGAHS
jgi:dienelactone hydrolase